MPSSLKIRNFTSLNLECREHGKLTKIESKNGVGLFSCLRCDFELGVVLC